MNGVEKAVNGVTALGTIIMHIVITDKKFIKLTFFSQCLFPNIFGRLIHILSRTEVKSHRQLLVVVLLNTAFCFLKIEVTLD